MLASSLSKGKKVVVKHVFSRLGLCRRLGLPLCMLLALAACKRGGAEIEDIYTPTAHYERYPIEVVKDKHGRLHAVSAECGDWSKSLTDTAANAPYENLGCAQQRNLAVLVANPRDFVKPRAETPADPMRRSEVFIKYRKGESSTTADTAEESAAVAKVTQQ